MEPSTTTKTTINILESLALVVGFTSITWESLGILGFLMAVDFATGILKTVSIYGFRQTFLSGPQNKFKSEKAFKGIFKKVTAWTIPLILQLMGQATQIDTSGFVYSIFTAIVVTECYSIFENIRSIHYDKEIKKQDFISLIMNRIAIFTDKFAKSQNLDNDIDSDKK